MIDPEKLQETMTLKGGEKIPIIGVGTFECEGSDAFNTCKWALEAGYRHLDLATAYWNQHEIAPAIAPYKRDELWITSKLWKDDDPDNIPGAIDKTLMDLKTDYIDLWLLHWPDKSIPWAETFGRMQEAVDAGKVKALGVCNATIRHLTEMIDSGAKIEMNQFEFHPYLYQPDLVAFCREQGIAVTGYSPIARGEILNEPLLTQLGEKYGKSAAQVSIRWVHQHGAIVIPKSVHQNRIIENADIFDFALTGEEMAQIDALNRGLRTILPPFQEFDYV